MGVSADAGQASDRTRMINTEAETLCNDQGCAISVRGGRCLQVVQIEQALSTEEGIAMRRVI
jgi:hypothetical protein